MKSIKEEFLYSLKTLVESNEQFFLVNIGINQKIKIYIDENGSDWVTFYKYNIHKKFRKIHNHLKFI